MTGEPGTTTAEIAVPPPVPPGDTDAWYAPDVQAQYEVFPGVVATIAATPKHELREHLLGKVL